MSTTTTTTSGATVSTLPLQLSPASARLQNALAVCPKRYQYDRHVLSSSFCVWSTQGRNHLHDVDNTVMYSSTLDCPCCTLIAMLCSGGCVSIISVSAIQNLDDLDMTSSMDARRCRTVANIDFRANGDGNETVETHTWSLDGCIYAVALQMSVRLFSEHDTFAVEMHRISTHFLPCSIAMSLPHVPSVDSEINTMSKPSMSHHKAYTVFIAGSCGVLVKTVHWKDADTRSNDKSQHNSLSSDIHGSLEERMDMCRLEENGPSWTLHRGLPIASVTISSDGLYLAVASLDSHIGVWTVPRKAGGEMNGNFDELTDLWKTLLPVTRVTALTFSPDGTRFAVASWDGQVFVFSLKDESEHAAEWYQDKSSSIMQSSIDTTPLSAGVEGDVENRVDDDGDAVVTTTVSAATITGWLPACLLCWSADSSSLAIAHPLPSSPSTRLEPIVSRDLLHAMSVSSSKSVEMEEPLTQCALRSDDLSVAGCQIDPGISAIKGVGVISVQLQRRKQRCGVGSKKHPKFSSALVVYERSSRSLNVVSWPRGLVESDAESLVAVTEPAPVVTPEGVILDVLATESALGRVCVSSSRGLVRLNINRPSVEDALTITVPFLDQTLFDSPLIACQWLGICIPVSTTAFIASYHRNDDDLMQLRGASILLTVAGIIITTTLVTYLFRTKDETWVAVAHTIPVAAVCVCDGGYIVVIIHINRAVSVWSAKVHGLQAPSEDLGNAGLSRLWLSSPGLLPIINMNGLVIAVGDDGSSRFAVISQKCDVMYIFEIASRFEVARINNAFATPSLKSMIAYLDIAIGSIIDKKVGPVQWCGIYEDVLLLRLVASADVCENEVESNVANQHKRYMWLQYDPSSDSCRCCYSQISPSELINAYKLGILFD